MKDEHALRRDVALANRIIERFGLSNAFGHVSARIPGTDRFYISTRRSPGLAEESGLLVIDTDGKILAGEGTPNSEFWIHARIYAARPDVGSVVHAHPPARNHAVVLRYFHHSIVDLPEHVGSDRYAPPPHGLGVRHLAAAHPGKVAIYEVATHLAFQSTVAQVPNVLENQQT